MNPKPNQTLIEGTVRAITPDADGYGSNMEIEVDRNLSLLAAADFLKPKSGERLALFTAETPRAEVGQRVRVQARLLGGPFGERCILEHLEVLAGGAHGH